MSPPSPDASLALLAFALYFLNKIINLSRTPRGVATHGKISRVLITSATADHPCPRSLLPYLCKRIPFPAISLNMRMSFSSSHCMDNLKIFTKNFNLVEKTLKNKYK